MIERILNDEERKLAERLKYEAHATRPEFSEALHARICAALKECEPSVGRRPVTWWLRSGWLPAAIAAALLVGVSLVAWWLNRPFGPGAELPEMVIAPVESPDPVADPGMITGPTARTAEHVGTLVDSTVSAGQWAYLDHDARVAFRLLMDQVPFDAASLE